MNLDGLFLEVRDELHRLAAHFFRSQAPNHTLQPTALINEAYLKLAKQDSLSWNDRSHFYRLAARAMRTILVDHARGKRALKRGGDASQVPLSEAQPQVVDSHMDFVGLDEALDALDEYDSRKKDVVELRYFGGLSVEETATVLEISPATVKREWAFARSWLHEYLSSH